MLDELLIGLRQYYLEFSLALVNQSFWSPKFSTKDLKGLFYLFVRRFHQNCCDVARRSFKKNCNNVTVPK
jgi:hypothetical protein